MPNDQMDVERDWRYVLVNKLGVPTLLLCLIGIGLYRASDWAGENIITPIVAKQIQVLSKIEPMLESTERNARESHAILVECRTFNQELREEINDCDLNSSRKEYTSETCRPFV